MKGPWEVIANPVGGEMMYGVARLIDQKKVKHSGNLEFYPCGYMEDRKEAEGIVEWLNQGDE